VAALLHWGLRRVPIFYKVLVANVLLVVLGAVCGTWLTIEQARARPDLQPLELVATFAIIGSALSTAINAVILRLALMPLDELERTAKAVQAGDLEARVVLGPISDPHTDRLAATLNSMLDLVAAKARAIERYSEHLQQLSAKVIRAQEDERKRIALELHDETGQALTSLAIGLRVLQGAKTLDEACSQAEELLRLTHRALDGVHNLALELRPKTLDDLGLVPALRSFLKEWNRHLKLAVDFSAQGLDCRLPPHVETSIYRLVQEALTNVAKHSRAGSVRVSLERVEDRLIVQVADDGQGFDPNQEFDAADGGRGIGLFGMKERMSIIGGTCTIQSAPGKGTVVRAEVPVGEPLLGE